jgi:hypothetical protein
MRVVVTIGDPAVVRRILAHVGLSSAPVRPDPAQPPQHAAVSLGWVR